MPEYIDPEDLPRPSEIAEDPAPPDDCNCALGSKYGCPVHDPIPPYDPETDPF